MADDQEDEFQVLRPPGKRGTAGDVARGVGRGLLGVPEGALGAEEAFYAQARRRLLGRTDLQVLIDPEKPLSFPGSKLLGRMAAMREAESGTKRRALGAFGEEHLGGEGLAYQTGQAIGSGVGIATASAAGTAIGIPPWITAATLGATMEAGDAYHQALSSFEDPESEEAQDSAFAAFVAGGAVGTSEAVPIAGQVGRFLGRVDRATGRVFKRALEQMVLEGGEEIVQENAQRVLSDVVAKYISQHDEERDVVGEFLERWQSGEAWLPPLVAGGLLSGVASASEAAQERRSGEPAAAPAKGAKAEPSPLVTPAPVERARPASENARRVAAQWLGEQGITGEVVEPRTPRQRAAAEFFRRRGAEAVFVRTTEAPAAPAGYANGVAVFDENIPGKQLERRLVLHEAQHHLRELVRAEEETFAGLATELEGGLRTLDPEGFERTEATVRERYRARGLDEAGIADEVVSNYLEQHGALLFEDARFQAALEQPGLGRRLVDAVIRMVRRLGIKLETSVEKRLRQLRNELAETDDEKEIRPTVIPEISRLVRKTFRELERLSVPRGTPAQKGPHGAQETAPVQHLPQGTQGAGVAVPPVPPGVRPLAHPGVPGGLPRPGAAPAAPMRGERAGPQQGPPMRPGGPPVPGAAAGHPRGGPLRARGGAVAMPAAPGRTARGDRGLPHGPAQQRAAAATTLAGAQVKRLRLKRGRLEARARAARAVGRRELAERLERELARMPRPPEHRGAPGRRRDLTAREHAIEEGEGGPEPVALSGNLEAAVGPARARQLELAERAARSERERAAARERKAAKAIKPAPTKGKGERPLRPGEATTVVYRLASSPTLAGKHFGTSERVASHIESTMDRGIAAGDRVYAWRVASSQAKMTAGDQRFGGGLPQGVAPDDVRAELVGQVEVKDLDSEFLSGPELERELGLRERVTVERAELEGEPAKIQERFARLVERAPEYMVSEYRKKFGNVLNTDNARELSSDYLRDRTLSSAVHEPASALMKEAYRTMLAEKPRRGQRPMVLFTAGGTGAGKSSGIEAVGRVRGLAARAQIVYDTNLATFSSSVAKIDQAVKAGKLVQVVYVHRDPVEALTQGALPRAMRQEGKFGSGRTVPLLEHVKTHIGASRVVRELAQHYRGNDRVVFSVVDNSRGKGKAAEVPFARLPNLGYDSAEVLYDALQQALKQEHQAGRISDAVYRGFAEGSPLVEEGHARQRAAVRPEPERARQASAGAVGARAPPATKAAPAKPGLIAHRPGRAGELAYHRGGPAGETLRTAMLEAAGRFGIDNAESIGGKTPLLVRIVAEGQEGKPGELSRILNEAMTTAKGATTEAVSRGSKITPAVAAQVARVIGDSTLREVIGEPAGARDVARILVQSGAMSQRDIDALFDPNRGIPTQAGKQVIEDALLGSVVTDVRALSETPPATRNALLRALPSLVTLKGSVPELSRTIVHAVEGAAEVASSGQPLNDVLGQQVMPGIDVGWKGDDLAVGILRSLLKDKPTVFAERLSRLAGRARDLAAGQTSFIPDENLPIGEQLALEFAPSPAMRLSLGTTWRRNFTAPGGLPREFFNSKIVRDGWINAHMQRAQDLDVDFRRAVRRHFGRKPTAAQLTQLDEAFKDPVKANALPAILRDPVRAMRQHVRELSQMLVSVGAVEGDLAARVMANLDFYATRSYRVFDDPRWAERVPLSIRNQAKAYLRISYPTYTDNQLERLINELLYEGKAAQSPIAMLARGQKLGSKDLGILTKRKAIAPEIRALFGEYTDPRVNYARSVAKMAFLVGNHQFLTDVRAEGLGRYLWEPSDPNVPAEAKAKIAAEESSVLFPLNGLVTTPEVEQAFRDYVEREQIPAWVQALMMVNAFGKYGKTVGSVMTHLRNWAGNLPFAIAQGHYRVHHFSSSLKVLATTFHRMNSQTWRDYYREALELGVIHESASASELRAVLEDVWHSGQAAWRPEGARARARGMLELLTRVYQAGDDFWKVYAWENEKARYRKTGQFASELELKKHAARIVRNTYPTYSMVPRAIRKLRRFPILGTFVSFPWEVLRTSKNTLALMASELRSKNPRVRAIGAQRFVGSLFAAGWTAALTAYARYLLGMTDDDDDAARELLPSWSRNSDLLWLGKDERGNRLYVDLSYTDPYKYLKQPLQALLRGDDWRDALQRSTVALFEPFLSEEMATRAVIDLMRNQTDEGQRIYNPAAPLDDQLGDVGAHLGKAIEPGTLTSLRRIYLGTQGVVIGTKAYDPKVEALAMTTGVRVSRLDLLQGVYRKAGDFAEESSDATRILTEVAGRRGRVTDDELEDAYRDMEAVRRRSWNRLQRAISASRALGLTDRQIEARIGAQIGEERARQAIRGRYESYEPSSSFLARQTRGVTGEERRELLRRLNVVRKLHLAQR